jgi:hypothetical protein
VKGGCYSERLLFIEAALHQNRRDWS